ncbi:hypothetical protein [Phenylobacterium sp.]|uniref:hypothetical protein n=1 Tax=Phenylobacterium sp. TaxID=1871053 RepID=UPI0011FCDB26|nr:hypothetical protein [Phenylobacterium sp.]THD71500.1 MAG: hypothetical protein E8A12_01480 [Phenylobacterium sp.]
MILHLAPGAPVVLRVLAETALALHVSGATVGLASGTVALIAPKGRRLHQVAGTTFFLAMLTMSGVAAVTAPLFSDRVSAMMGVFVFYLTATAWAAVQRPAGQVGRFESGAALAAVAVVAGDLAIGVVGGRMPKGVLDGEPSQVGYVFAVVATLALIGDLRMIRQGGVFGRQRIARHLWRMCAALAIAWGSFAGQPRAQPEALRGSLWLITPALLVVAAMIFWLIRVRLQSPRKSPKTRAAMSAAPMHGVLS